MLTHPKERIALLHHARNEIGSAVEKIERAKPRTVFGLVESDLEDCRGHLLIADGRLGLVIQQAARAGAPAATERADIAEARISSTNAAREVLSASILLQYVRERIVQANESYPSLVFVEARRHVDQVSENLLELRKRLLGIHEYLETINSTGAKNGA